METLAAIFAEIFQGLTLAKILVAVGMVVLVAYLAENVSPRFAGIFAGFPLGSAISLFFIGYELGPDFAGQAAVYAISGLTATMAFSYFYYRASLPLEKLPRIPAIALATLQALAGYFVVIFLLRLVDYNRITACAVSIAAIFLFDRLFSKIPNVLIADRSRLSVALLAARAGTAAAIIILVTSGAKLIGPRWAGLFAAFPMAILPLIVIIHFTYRPEHVYTILKNLPRGMGSLVVYGLVVSYAYPAWGIYLGTLIGYAFATVFLILLTMRYRPPKKKAAVTGR